MAVSNKEQQLIFESNDFFKTELAYDTLVFPYLKWSVTKKSLFLKASHTPIHPNIPNRLPAVNPNV